MAKNKTPKVGDPVLYRVGCNEGPSRTIARIDSDARAEYAVLHGTECLTAVHVGKDKVATILESGEIRELQDGGLAVAEAVARGETPEGARVRTSVPRRTTTVLVSNLEWSEEDSAWLVSGMMLSAGECEFFHQKFGRPLEVGEDLWARSQIRVLDPSALSEARRQKIIDRVGEEGFAALLASRN